MANKHVLAGSRFILAKVLCTGGDCVANQIIQ